MPTPKGARHRSIVIYRMGIIPSASTYTNNPTIIVVACYHRKVSFRRFDSLTTTMIADVAIICVICLFYYLLCMLLFCVNNHLMFQVNQHKSERHCKDSQKETKLKHRQAKKLLVSAKFFISNLLFNFSAHEVLVRSH